MSLSGITQTRAQDIDVIRRMCQVAETQVETKEAKVEQVAESSEDNKLLEIKEIEELEAEAEAAALRMEAVDEPFPIFFSSKSQAMMSRNAAANLGASPYVPLDRLRRGYLSLESLMN
jgi:hypothetical protein